MNLLDGTDLMGYGWPGLSDPVLSDCDLDAFTLVFAWALEGVEPYPPGEGPYDCSLSTEPGGHRARAYHGRVRRRRRGPARDR